MSEPPINSGDEAIKVSPGPRFMTAMIVAIVADALQILILPAFVEGAISPADDILDFGVAALMVNLLGWHWEFLPSFLLKLAPGIDLVPLWSLAVANVYRKSKAKFTAEVGHNEQPKLQGPQRQ